MAEREAVFVAWLHENGYTFIGENSLYKLTHREISVLQDGFEVMQEQQEMAEKGVSEYEQRKFKEYADDVNSP